MKRECIACENEVCGELIQDEFDNYVDWPDACPHCNETNFLGEPDFDGGRVERRQLGIGS